MSNCKTEKDKTERNININKYESNSNREKNTLQKNRKFLSNPKFINKKNLDILQNRHLPNLKKNNYFQYDTTKEKTTNQVSVPIPYRRNNSHNNNYFYDQQREKEKLIMEINQSNNELKSQDKELKKFQNLYGTIKRENLANQFLLYQIMNKEKKKEKENNKEQSKENNKTETEKEIILKDQISTNNNNDKNSISNKDDKYSNSNIDTHSFFLTGTNLLSDIVSKNNYTNYSNKAKSTNRKNKTCYLKNKKDSSKLKLLKKELDYYIRTINEDTKKLEKFKENHKISGYLQAKGELDKKNQELDDLMKISKALQEKIKDHDMVIYFYKLKNNNFITLINEIKKRIEAKHKPIFSNLEKRVKKLESQKEILENQNKIYKTEIDTLKEENEKNKKKRRGIKEIYRKK